MGFNTTNCPTHTAFITYEQFLNNIKDVTPFAYYYIDRIVGMVILKNISDSVFQIKNLSVLPEQRHNGYGRLLLEKCIEEAKAEKGSRIILDIIYENKKLMEWYCKYGFIITEIKKYDHLPFTVCNMEYKIK